MFPIFPRRVHRIVIGYDVDLTAVGDDLEYRLDLPGDVPNCVADISVAAPPGTGSHTAPLAFGHVQDGRRHYRFENPVKRSIAVRLPKAGPLMLTGRGATPGRYFAAAFRPELPAALRKDSASRAVFMLDTSLSANPDKFNVYLKLLREILDRNRDSLREFAVLCFDVSPRWWREKWSTNSPETVTELLAHAEGLALEGATDLGAALREAAAPAWIGGAKNRRTCDLFLLSDGGASWGQDRLAALSGALGTGFTGKVFAYRTGMAGTDGEILTHLARETGGAVFSVASEDGLAAAARAHRSLPWRIEGVSIPGASDVLIAGRPGSIYAGQRLALAGRGSPAEGAECLLALSRNGERREVRTRLGTRIQSVLAARAYGQMAVNQLEAAGAAAERAARAYAIHFRVTGRTCSLLMLESEADYARFKIRPQGEAELVRRSPAGRGVTNALAGARRLRDAPKKAFLDSLERLAASPGLSFKVGPELKAALDAMPARAFDVTAEKLDCRALLRKNLPSGHLRRLAEMKTGYDGIAAEADRRLKRYGAADALRAMSSLVETDPGDGPVVRDVGFTALQWGFGGHAYHLFRRRAAARPYNPQNYRAMGLALVRAGRTDLAMACFEVALAGNWDRRFGHVRAITGLDYLRLLRAIKRKQMTTSVPEFARARLASVSREFGVGGADLLVSVTWNTDATDVDLHVTEPTGETCSYRRQQTKAGGALSRDVTAGYGPETYMIRGAPAGRYRIRVHYFASDRNRTSMRTRVYATIVTGWGTDREKAVHKVVTLVGTRKLQDVATVSLGG
ncbi:MAG: DUF2135 domain-containing protein [Planctomycetota bacterium]